MCLCRQIEELLIRYAYLSRTVSSDQLLAYSAVKLDIYLSLMYYTFNNREEGYI